MKFLYTLLLASATLAAAQDGAPPAPPAPPAPACPAPATPQAPAPPAAAPLPEVETEAAAEAEIPEPADKDEEEAVFSPYLDADETAPSDLDSIGVPEPEPVAAPAAPAPPPTTTPKPTAEEVAQQAEAARTRRLQDQEDGNRRLKEEICRRRLVAGAEVNSKLAGAMRRGDVEGVRLLIENGADPNAEYGEVDFESCSLAHMAVYWDDSIDHEVEIVQALVDSGKVNWDRICGQQDKSVPLYEAVRHNNTAAFNMLLPLTTNFAGLDVRGRDMLWCACAERCANNDHMCAALATAMGGAGRRLAGEVGDEVSEAFLQEVAGGNQERRRQLRAIADDPTSHIDEKSHGGIALKNFAGKMGGGLFGSRSTIPAGQREL